MKFIQKISYIFTSCFFIIILISFIINKQLFYNEILSTIIIWFKKVLPAISISFIISSFLNNYSFLSYFLYPLLRHIYHFENQKSCSLFLLSIIVGNPTSTKLIAASVINNEISHEEANRLLSYSSFISSIFLYSIFDLYLFLLILIIELITATILAQLNKNTNKVIKYNTITTNNILDVYLNIINTLPTMLLSILVSMIICNIFSLYITNHYLKALFELTNGIIILLSKNNSLFTFIILDILIISHGLAIILQIYWIIKKTSLSFKNYVTTRIIAVVISLISLILIYLFIFFL